MAAGTGASYDVLPSALLGEERQRQGQKQIERQRVRERGIPEDYWQLGLVHWQLELELVMMFFLQFCQGKHSNQTVLHLKKKITYSQVNLRYGNAKNFAPLN